MPWECSKKHWNSNDRSTTCSGCIQETEQENETLKAEVVRLKRAIERIHDEHDIHKSVKTIRNFAFKTLNPDTNIEE
jgi:cell division protein FtsB